MARWAVRGILSPGGEPEGTESNPRGDPEMVIADPERQGAGRPGADVQTPPPQPVRRTAVPIPGEKEI